MPQEFTSVTASSYDAAGLATKLTEKSADGWEVVGIVNSGTEIAAFLKREGSGATTSASSASSSTPNYSAGTTGAATAGAGEPAGWGSSPSSSSPASGATTYPSSSGSSGADPSSGYSAASQPSSATAAPAASAAASSTSSVPAGWYADPAGRFDLRYWDGNTWTEHVSRAGQQFTDPPVA